MQREYARCPDVNIPLCEDVNVAAGYGEDALIDGLRASHVQSHGDLARGSKETNVTPVRGFDFPRGQRDVPLLLCRAREKSLDGGSSVGVRGRSIISGIVITSGVAEYKIEYPKGLDALLCGWQLVEGAPDLRARS